MDKETPLENAQQKQQMLDVLDEYFNRGVDKKKFINTDRIPLICQDIAYIHQRIEKIDDSLTWIVRLIVGAVVLALLGLVFVSKTTIGL